MLTIVKIVDFVFDQIDDPLRRSTAYGVWKDRSFEVLLLFCVLSEDVLLRVGSKVLMLKLQR
jgi:hypothetical protein